MRGFALISSALVACSGDITVVDDDDAIPSTGGATGATGGAGGAGATGGVGGDTGGGGGEGGNGGEPSTLPDCPALHEAGDLLHVEGGFDGFLVPVSPTELGIVYRARGEGLGHWETRSSILMDAFGSWPPSTTDAIWHADYGPEPPNTQTRDGGDFTMWSWGGGWLVSSVHEEGSFMSSSQSFDRPILEPPPGIGVFLPESDHLSYFPTLDAEQPTATIEIPPELGALGTYGSNDVGELVLQGDEAFFHLRGGMLVEGARVPPLEGWYTSIIPRTGGFWYGAWRPTVEVYAVLKDGTGVSGGFRPFGDRSFTDDVAMARWRDGVAIAASGQEDGGFSVAVTDGSHATSLRLSGAETDLCLNGISVVASPSGESVFVGYLRCHLSDEPIFTVRRFDCAL